MQKGMSWPDFEQYLHHVAADITKKTTVNTLELSGPLVKVSSKSADDSSPVRAADLADLKVALLGMENQQVVYVSSL